MSSRLIRRILCVPAFLLVVIGLAGCGQTTAQSLSPETEAALSMETEVIWSDAPADSLVKDDTMGVSLAAADEVGVVFGATDGLGSTVFRPVEGVTLAQMFAAVEIAFAKPDGGQLYHFATVESGDIR